LVKKPKHFLTVRNTPQTKTSRVSKHVFHILALGWRGNSKTIISLMILLFFSTMANATLQQQQTHYWLGWGIKGNREVYAWDYESKLTWV